MNNSNNLSQIKSKLILKTENLKSNEIPFEVLTYLQPNRINDDDEVHDVHGGGHVIPLVAMFMMRTK